MWRENVLFSLLVSLGFILTCKADLKQLIRKIPDVNLTFALEWDDLEEVKNSVTEADYYTLFEDSNGKRTRRAASQRPGSATTTHSCDFIRQVPNSLRYATNMRPNGLSQFYQKYTEAYGIPVLGSRIVSDEALKRACYVVRFLMADHSGVRNSYYKLSGRVAIMDSTEQTTSIPEHAWLGSSWNQRARGLGATEYAPVSTGGEENVMCFKRGDRYYREDIFLHEFSHGMHLLGAKYAIPGWNNRLQNLYRLSKSSGKWRNTYSMSTKAEYFAEGVQSYFEVNSYSPQPDGVHGPVNTRAKLLAYDPALYQLIREVFPCNNKYIKRCKNDRVGEKNQKLEMNCNEPKTSTQRPSTTIITSTGTTSNTESTQTTGNMTTTKPQTTTPTASTTIVTKVTKPPTDCQDYSHHCQYWSEQGECSNNPQYMLTNCQRSCNSCSRKGRTCRDDEPSCLYWASHGECQKNPNYMLLYCKRSCQSC